MIRPALVLLLLFTALTGGIYPAAITAISQLAFSEQANGSLLRKGDAVLGSALIGQPFDSPKYFFGRPSACAFNAAASSGSNLGPSNPALVAAVSARMNALRALDPDNRALVPVDLVTASGSGLDPHISPAAAEYQVPRVARARGVSDGVIRGLVVANTEGRTFGVLGEPRVNVLRLNLAIDATVTTPHLQPAGGGDTVEH